MRRDYPGVHVDLFQWIGVRQFQVERLGQAVKVCEIDLDEQGRPHFKCWIPSRQRRQ